MACLRCIHMHTTELITVASCWLRATVIVQKRQCSRVWIEWTAQAKQPCLALPRKKEIVRATGDADADGCWCPASHAGYFTSCPSNSSMKMLSIVCGRWLMIDRCTYEPATRATASSSSSIGGAALLSSFLSFFSKIWEMTSGMKSSTVIDLVLVITTRYWIISFEKTKSFDEPSLSFSWFLKGCWRLRTHGIWLHSGRFAAAATDLLQKSSQCYSPVNDVAESIIYCFERRKNYQVVRACEPTAMLPCQGTALLQQAVYMRCLLCRNKIGNLEALLAVRIPEAVIDSFIDTANFAIAISANKLCQRAVVKEWQIKTHYINDHLQHSPPSKAVCWMDESRVCQL